MCYDAGRQCLICLEDTPSWSQLRVCNNPQCQCRIHLGCYYQWIKFMSFTGKCVCEESIDCRRFLLPGPMFRSLCPRAGDISNPWLHLLSTPSEQSWSDCLWRWSDRATYLTRYYLTWLLGCGYLGKLAVTSWGFSISWNIFTQPGILTHLYCIPIGLVTLIVIYLVVGKVRNICGSATPPSSD